MALQKLGFMVIIICVWQSLRLAHSWSGGKGKVIVLYSISSVGVTASQVPLGRMIIFGNGWVPLGHLTMYWQECHNAQHTRGYIESRKSNFSLYDNLGYIEAKTYILEKKKLYHIKHSR